MHQRFIAVVTAMTLILIPTLAACESRTQQSFANAVNGESAMNQQNINTAVQSNDEIATGEDVALPTNWPLPVPKSGSIVMVTVQTDGTAYGMWVIVAPAKKVADSYGNLLLADGFEITQQTNLDGAIMRDYFGTGLFVSVVVGHADTETTLAITGIPQ